MNTGQPADRNIERWIVASMIFAAFTLAVTAFLHLDGVLLRGAKPFQPTHAGIAESLIGLALTYGALALVRQWPHAQSVALGTTAFAILGFAFGLNFTIRGAGAIDIAYHLAVLPLLVLTMVALLRRPRHK
jgi:hypothetical protein